MKFRYCSLLLALDLLDTGGGLVSAPFVPDSFSSSDIAHFHLTTGMTTVYFGIALWTFGPVAPVAFDVTRNSSGYYVGKYVQKPGMDPIAPLMINAKNTGGIIAYKQHGLYDDTQPGYQQACNQRNQYVYNLMTPGRIDLTQYSGYNNIDGEDEYIAVLCIEAGSYCPNGIGLCPSDDPEDVCDDLYRKERGPTALLTLTGLKNSRNKTLFSSSIAQPFSCFLHRFVWPAITSYGDRDCRMTLTIIDRQHFDSDGRVCQYSPGNHSNMCCAIDWGNGDAMTFKAGYTPDIVMDGEDALLNGKLVQYDDQGNLFINVGYEQQITTSAKPKPFLIPYPLTRANAILDLIVCVRKNANCERGLLLKMGSCNITMLTESLGNLTEAKCWAGTWNTGNTALDDGLVIEYEPACKMHVVINCDSIRSCEHGWFPIYDKDYSSHVADKHAKITTEKQTYTKGYTYENGSAFGKVDASQTGKNDQTGGSSGITDENKHTNWTKAGWNINANLGFNGQKNQGSPVTEKSSGSGSSSSSEKGKRVKRNGLAAAGGLANLGDKVKGAGGISAGIGGGYNEEWGGIDERKVQLQHSESQNSVRYEDYKGTISSSQSEKWTVTETLQIETSIDIYPGTHYLLEQEYVTCGPVTWKSAKTRLSLTYSDGRKERYWSSNSSDPRFFSGTCIVNKNCTSNGATPGQNATGNPADSTDNPSNGANIHRALEIFMAAFALLLLMGLD